MFDRRSLTIPRVVAAMITVTLLGACSSSAKSSSGASSTTTTPEASTTTGTASSAICQSVSDFRSSLSALTEASTYTGGKSSAQAALDNVKTSLNNVQSAVSSGDKPKVEALRSSITDLQHAIDNMNGLGDVGDVVSAGKNVATSAQDVLDALKAGCPSS
jgi:hypothetical protein